MELPSSPLSMHNHAKTVVHDKRANYVLRGIGLIIPIQESMKKPQKFPAVLGGVMILITIIFTSMGALSYMAFGSSTKTVVLLNLPQNSKFVNGSVILFLSFSPLGGCSL